MILLAFALGAGLGLAVLAAEAVAAVVIIETLDYLDRRHQR